MRLMAKLAIAVFAASICSARVAASPTALGIVSEHKLLQLSPRSKGIFVRELAAAKDLLDLAEINTEQRIRHFIVQLCTETGGLQRLDENLNYSAEQMVRIFKRRVTPEKALSLAYKPVPTANFVYAGRLGNGDEASGDGWRFRGSGYMQLTGRENFRARGKELGLPFETDPDSVRKPEQGLKAAVMYWKSRNINVHADRDDIEAVRKAVNGGLNGIEHARLWNLRAKRLLVFGDPRSSPSDEELQLQAEITAQSLRALGYLPPSNAPSAPVSIEEAIFGLQRDNGLELTGYLDEDTFYKIIESRSPETDN